jgi:signal transduction histidine kinase
MNSPIPNHAASRRDFPYLGQSGEMVELIRAFDWDGTSLGAPSRWPDSLRTALSICLGSHIPTAIWWGPEQIQFYNDAYRPMLGASKHPGALGSPARLTWPETWSALGPMAEQVLTHGETLKGDDLPFMLDRNGYRELCFFTFSQSPIREADGSITGMFAAAIETTSRVLAERRQAFHLNLADRLRGLNSPHEITGIACKLLGEQMLATRVGYTDVEESTGMLLVKQGWTDGSVPSIIGQTLLMASFGRHVVAEVSAGRTLLLNDVTTDPRSADSVEAYRKLGVQAVLVVPLVRGDKLISVVAVSSAEPRRWTKEDVTLAEDAAERTRSAVERGIAELALKRQLEMERDRLHALFDQAPGFMAVLRGPDHVFELVNGAYHRLVGERDLLGKPVREALPEATGQKFFERLDQVFRSGKAFSALDASLMVRQFPDAAPVQRYVDFIYQPVIDAEGAVTGIFVEGYDVTERKLAGDALREADRRKDEFLAMLAHELRNPLAPISAASELMRSVQLDDAGIKRTSDIIARQVGHMTDLVDDLLDVSRVTRGLVTLNELPQDLKGIVSSAVEQARPVIEARRHRLAVHLAREPVYVMGDQKRLIQVLANLLNNAAKYTPEGGEIAVSMEVAEHDVLLHIADNGIGIAPELQARVFDLFAQAERSPDRAQGGLGLGLALVKSLVELHGGTVSCHSDGPGAGSRFSISLPRLAEAYGGADMRPGETTVRKTDKALRIMIVDDNADAAHMLAMFLESAGHDVMVENGSRRALERAVIERPDVCLLDIGMPDLDGNELARRLRSRVETNRALLIAVTGYGQEHDRQATRAAGFDHHMVKPVDTARLIELLAKI